MPSLADHRGEHSLIGNGRKGRRRAATVRKLEKEGPTLREVREIRSVPRAIVYPWLSRGAVWEELRYSLRSVEKYCEDRTCPIYILGDQAPAWLEQGGRVRFIQLDGYARHPKNRSHAVFQAKAIGMQLAEEVLWMNDDFYALKPLRFEDFSTALHAGEITAEAKIMLGNRGSGWARNIAAAALDLMAAGVKRVWKFSTHTPQLYERAKALEILRNFHVSFSGGFENLYHNWHGTPRRAVGSQRASSLPAKASARFLNHPAVGPNERTRAELRRIFPEAAPWEISIPRRIHQTWKDAEIPHDIYPREWVESWQAQHPEWTYKLWTDADLLQLAREHYPEFIPLMERARGVVKADVGRLLMLHHEGGLYADLDYHCLRPMDRLLDGGAVWVCTMEGGYTHNALLASIPGHPMLLAAAREAMARWQRSPQSSPEWISGPSLLEDFAEKWHPSRWTAAEVCPLDWRDEEHLGDWKVLLDRCKDAHAVTFWRHNW